MSQRASPNTFMISLLAGMTGATIALLFAPRSGAETRAKLKERKDDLKNKAHDSVANAKENLDSNWGKAKDLKSRFSESMKSSDSRANSGSEENLFDRDHPIDRQSPVLTSWEEEV